MSVGEGHINQAEFPEAAVQQAREEYSADSDSYGEKDPFKLKKEKKEIDKKKKEKGYKTFEAESFSEEDDERGKGKKRPSLFKSRFAPSAKTKPKDRVKGVEKDGKTDERRLSKDKIKEEKKVKGGVEEKKVKGSSEEKKSKGVADDKKRSKSKEREKLKKKSHTIDIPNVKPEPVFGAPFEDAVTRSKLYDNIELPRVVRECIDCVEEYGMSTAGIYRLSGVKSKVEALKALYDADEKVNLQEVDPTTITSLLKLYLRELPETVLTNTLTPAFEHVSGLPKSEARTETFKKILTQLPTCNFTLISWLMVHLAHVLEKKEETKMTIQNLSIVMCPTLRVSHRTMNLLFTEWRNLFGDVVLKRCPKPLEWIPGSVFEMPETTAEIEDELLRHETILAKMHEDLNHGVAHKSTEDHLWEVQRVVTQLKRKLRVSRRVSETRLAAKEKEMEGKDAKVVSKEKSPAKGVSLPPETSKQTNEEHVPAESNVETEEKASNEEASSAPEQTEVDGNKAEETQEDKEPPEEIKEEAEERTKVEDSVNESAEPDLEMVKLLLLSQAEVVAEKEELMNIRNDLQKRIEAEQQEIARLQSAITEAKQAARRRGASVDSIDSSAASESSSESEDEEELHKILEGLIRENEELKRKNMQLSYNIHNEREACAELRVQIKLQQQMPQMLEALAQAGLKKEPVARETDLKEEPEANQKEPEAAHKAKDETIAEPIKNSTTVKNKTIQNENMNSNASSEAVKDEGEVDSEPAAVVNQDVQKGTERHVEETAL
ncbi:ralA-binding protein 1-like [Diadema antillarum]|uniref:ralA-binding protein 1-like n=1 Tax=Diadema antillarum TaxID=105358 RepID=UPI003A8808C2